MSPPMLTAQILREAGQKGAQKSGAGQWEMDHILHMLLA